MMDQTSLILLAGLLREFRDWSVTVRLGESTTAAIETVRLVVLAEILPSMRPKE